MKKVYLFVLLMLMLQMVQAATSISVSDVLSKIKKYEGSKATGGFYLLDSIIENNSSNECQEKYLYSFAGAVNEVVITESYYRFNSNNIFGLSDSSRFSCDLLNKRITEMNFTWNNTSNKWVSLYKTEYTFDNEYHIILKISYSWSASTNSWGFYSKIENAYSKDGSQTLEAYYVWDSLLKKWIGDEEDGKTEWLVDNTGKEIQINSDWDDEKDTWEYSNKYESITYEPGDSSLFSFYFWDSSVGTWKNTINYKTEVTSVGNKKIDIRYTWDNVGNCWVNNSKSETTTEIVDNVGNNEVHVYSSWSTLTKAWELSSKSEYTLDINKNTTAVSDFSFIKETQSWKRINKYEYTFDLNSNKTSQTFFSVYSNDSSSISMKEVWIYDNQGNMIQQESYSDVVEYVDGDFHWFLGLTSSEHYYYTFVTNTSVSKAIDKNEYSLYPNPVSGTFRINGVTDGAFIQILNLNGHVLSNKRINGDNPVSVGDLPEGLYFVKIPTDNGSVILKMVKE
jgi:hypothetical protein